MTLHVMTMIGSIVGLFLFLPTTMAQQQKSGEPLYLPQKEYPSDLAPETDPHWQHEKDRYQKSGEDPYEEPVESYYEKNVHYKKIKKPVKRRHH
ncbi:MAG: hypothetical protein HY540_04855 [Deltaproteobacteria bacterium]|nr:hypothetical protein [Deltaproteobacteria bacterium]